VVEMMLDATRKRPTLDRERSSAGIPAVPVWPQRNERIAAGAWRTDSSVPMQVVSGRLAGARTFEAPAAERLTARWGVSSTVQRGGDAIRNWVVKARAGASMVCDDSPFEDEMPHSAAIRICVCRPKKARKRFYSMSAADSRSPGACLLWRLELAQKGTMDVTQWLDWFLECLARLSMGARGASWSAGQIEILGVRWTVALNDRRDSCFIVSSTILKAS